MKSSELYAIQIEGLRNGIINEIRLLLKNNNLTEIEIQIGRASCRERV